ncbi:MAG: hypothetical protein K2W82_13500 [Candidatus Obscuribacterales bacterium]|nr:hypothetical protein [Candidatus Obscuribacterales bacterium]
MVSSELLSFEAFLVKSGVIDASEISRLRDVCQAIGVPEGKLLVSEGYLSKNELRNISLLYSFIADRIFSLDEALLRLPKLSLDPDSFLEELNAKSEESLILGLLLWQSGLVSPAMIEQALNAALDQAVLLGHALIHLRHLTPTLLSAVLEIQNQKRSGTITRAQALAAAGKLL